MRFFSAIGIDGSGDSRMWVRGRALGFEVADGGQGATEQKLYWE